tara:strand:- start:677 stop:1363 length:687 start_codon:yes stop_codon:yes gene_type:complete
LIKKRKNVFNILLVWYLILSIIYPDDNDFWAQAFRLAHESKVSHFNTLKIKEGAIIMLGDSITAGCNWNELFDGLNIINRGIGGDVTSGIINRIDFLKTCKPSAVFLLIGTNNLGQSDGIDKIISEYKIIIDKITSFAPDTDLYIQSVLPINPNKFMFPRPDYNNEKIKNLNSLIKNLEQNRVSYIHLFEYFTDKKGNLDERYSNDGLHLNGLGYQKWKEILVKNNIL